MLYREISKIFREMSIELASRRPGFFQRCCKVPFSNVGLQIHVNSFCSFVYLIYFKNYHFIHWHCKATFPLCTFLLNSMLVWPNYMKIYLFIYIFYLCNINLGPLMTDVHMHRPTTNSKHFTDALGAFWPGLQVTNQLSGMQMFRCKLFRIKGIGWCSIKFW